MVLIAADTPEFDEALNCPECGDKANVLSGHGIIGGGIGPYTMCEHCGFLISKSQDEDLCDSHEAVELKDVEDNKTDGTTGVDEQSGGTFPSPRK